MLVYYFMINQQCIIKHSQVVELPYTDIFLNLQTFPYSAEQDIHNITKTNSELSNKHIFDPTLLGKFDKKLIIIGSVRKNYGMRPSCCSGMLYSFLSKCIYSNRMSETVGCVSLPETT